MKRELCPMRRSAIPIVRCVLLISLAALPCSCGEERGDAPGDQAARFSDPPKHILIVTADTLRTRHLGCYGNSEDLTPNLDRIAAEGVKFERAQAPRGLTHPSLTSMMTGLPPITHGVRHNKLVGSDELIFVSEYIRKAGYRTGAFMSNFGRSVSQAARRRGFDHVFNARQGGVIDQHRMDQAATVRAAKWIRTNRGRPTFTWVHYIDPHNPYEPPPSLEESVQETYDGWLSDVVSVAELRMYIRKGECALTEQQLDQYLAADKKKVAKRAPRLPANNLIFEDLLEIITLFEVDLDAQDQAYIRARYDAQIRAMDARIGLLLKALEESGLTDETLVLFTADHGEELYEHNHFFWHNGSIYQGVLDIPLVMRWPGRFDAGTVVEGLVELMDVCPTLLQIMNLPLPPGIEAESFLSMVGGPGTRTNRYAVAEIFPRLRAKGSAGKGERANVFAIRDARWKLIWNPSGLNPRTKPYTLLEDHGFELAHEELYDLDRDPTEQVDLASREVREKIADSEYLMSAFHAKVALLSRLTRWLDEHENGTRFESAPVSGNAARQLDALGYTSGAPKVTRSDTTSEARDEHFLQDMLRASVAEKNHWVHAEVLARLGRGDQARAALNEALRGAPPPSGESARKRKDRIEALLER